MLLLNTIAEVYGQSRREVFKAVTPDEAAGHEWPIDRCLVFDPDGNLNSRIHQDWGGWLTYTDKRAPGEWKGLWINNLKDPDVVKGGDVIRAVGGQPRVQVLYRRGANANSLFATDRCNNWCLMCSQPPLDVEDIWRVREMIQTVALIDREEAQLGITGGEPTLLGQGLLDVLTACREFLPETFIHILTNGRRFCDAEFARLASEPNSKVTWAVPIYGDNPADHDYVVQVQGAFDETIKGLYNLARQKQDIEIRVVLHQQTIRRLGQLAQFIYRNLPFAKHVALMGLEPMGFAKANRDALWIDPLDYLDELTSATFHLANRGINVSIYNLPLCVLPEVLWPFARQSISDWKNVYVPECEGCQVKDQCAGFFMSAGESWRSRGIAPIKRGEVVTA
jgi:His-Xaa-Ser system radical SAM maturase HxsC